MKYMVFGDCHGVKPKVHFNSFDAILAPGDFCSSDEIRDYHFRAIKERMKNPGSKIKWYDLTGESHATEMIKTSFEDGRDVLEYLDSKGVPVYIVPGNADFKPDKKEKLPILQKINFNSLIKGLQNVVNADMKIVDSNENQIVGYGATTGPEYPQYKEDLERFKDSLNNMKADYARKRKKIFSLMEKATKPVILLSHNVLFNSTLDKITHKESPRYGYHYGSLILRDVIEKYHPPVNIGGHMHENQGKFMSGKTLCANAGFGPDANALLEMNGNKAKLTFYKV